MKADKIPTWSDDLPCGDDSKQRLTEKRAKLRQTLQHKVIGLAEWALDKTNQPRKRQKVGDSRTGHDASAKRIEPPGMTRLPLKPLPLQQPGFSTPATHRLPAPGPHRQAGGPVDPPSTIKTTDFSSFAKKQSSRLHIQPTKARAYATLPVQPFQTSKNRAQKGPKDPESTLRAGSTEGLSSSKLDLARPSLGREGVAQHLQAGKQGSSSPRVLDNGNQQSVKRPATAGECSAAMYQENKDRLDLAQDGPLSGLHEGQLQRPKTQAEPLQSKQMPTAKLKSSRHIRSAAEPDATGSPAWRQKKKRAKQPARQQVLEMRSCDPPQSFSRAAGPRKPDVPAPQAAMLSSGAGRKASTATGSQETKHDRVPSTPDTTNKCRPAPSNVVPETPEEDGLRFTRHKSVCQAEAAEQGVPNARRAPEQLFDMGKPETQSRDAGRVQSELPSEQVHQADGLDGLRTAVGVNRGQEKPEPQEQSSLALRTHVGSLSTDQLAETPDDLHLESIPSARHNAVHGKSGSLSRLIGRGSKKQPSGDSSIKASHEPQQSMGMGGLGSAQEAEEIACTAEDASPQSEHIQDGNIGYRHPASSHPLLGVLPVEYASCPDALSKSPVARPQTSRIHQAKGCVPLGTFIPETALVPESASEASRSHSAGQQRTEPTEYPDKTLGGNASGDQQDTGLQERGVQQQEDKADGVKQPSIFQKWKSPDMARVDPKAFGTCIADTPPLPASEAESGPGIEHAYDSDGRSSDSMGPSSAGLAKHLSQGGELRSRTAGMTKIGSESQGLEGCVLDTVAPVASVAFCAHARLIAIVLRPGAGLDSLHVFDMAEAQPRHVYQTSIDHVEQPSHQQIAFGLLKGKVVLYGIAGGAQQLYSFQFSRQASGWEASGRQCIQAPFAASCIFTNSQALLFIAGTQAHLAEVGASARPAFFSFAAPCLNGLHRVVSLEIGGPDKLLSLDAGGNLAIWDCIRRTCIQYCEHETLAICRASPCMLTSLPSESDYFILEVQPRHADTHASEVSGSTKPDCKRWMTGRLTGSQFEMTSIDGCKDLQDVCQAGEWTVTADSSSRICIAKFKQGRAVFGADIAVLMGARLTHMYIGSVSDNSEVCLIVAATTHGRCLLLQTSCL